MPGSEVDAMSPEQLSFYAEMLGRIEAERRVMDLRLDATASTAAMDGGKHAQGVADRIAGDLADASREATHEPDVIVRSVPAPEADALMASADAYWRRRT